MSEAFAVVCENVQSELKIFEGELFFFSEENTASMQRTCLRFFILELSHFEVCPEAWVAGREQGEVDSCGLYQIVWVP